MNLKFVVSHNSCSMFQLELWKSPFSFSDLWTLLCLAVGNRVCEGTGRVDFSSTDIRHRLPERKLGWGRVARCDGIVQKSASFLLCVMEENPFWGMDSYSCHKVPIWCRVNHRLVARCSVFLSKLDLFFSTWNRKSWMVWVLLHTMYFFSVYLLIFSDTRVILRCSRFQLLSN